MEPCCGSIDSDFDLVVVGSGAAGLTTALSALDCGAKVAVLEKSTRLGGTSALSGGMLWIPANDAAAAAGFEDSREAAFSYPRAVTKGRGNEELLRAHVDRGQELIDYLADASDLRFRLIGAFPDYYAEFDGGRAGGRSIEPEAYELGRLGHLRRWIRDDPRPPFCQWESFEVWRTFANFPSDELERRRLAGVVTRGTALIAPCQSSRRSRGHDHRWLLCRAPDHRCRAR
jgi:3-oxosteroid 1-dehydrogenase